MKEVDGSEEAGVQTSRHHHSEESNLTDGLHFYDVTNDDSRHPNSRTNSDIDSSSLHYECGSLGSNKYLYVDRKIAISANKGIEREGSSLLLSQSSQVLDFNGILEAVGGFGRQQKVLKYLKA